MAKLRIVSESKLPSSDWHQPAQFTWREFYDFRNHVIRVLRRFGSAGPMGEVDLSTDDQSAPKFLGPAIDEPDYFVVDDMWNEHERLSVVECAPRHVTADMLGALAEMAAAFPGWWVKLNLGDSGLVVFGDKAVPLGRRFWDCKGIDEIADRCTKPIDYGRAPPFSEAMYAVWLELVRGESRSVRHWPRSSQRQWVEARHVLDEMSRRWEGRASIQFAYDGIRHDLHPKMRSQFVQRFLVTLASQPKSTMEQLRISKGMRAKRCGCGRTPTTGSA